MEEFLAEVIKLTSCEPKFIAQFVQCGILNEIDAKFLERPHLTPCEKAAHLSAMICNRTGSYEVLLQSLKAVNKSTVLKLLQPSNFTTLNYESDSNCATSFPGTGVYGVYAFKKPLIRRDLVAKTIKIKLLENEKTSLEVTFLKRLCDLDSQTHFSSAEKTHGLITKILKHHLHTICYTSLADEVNINMTKIEPAIILKQCTKALTHLHRNKIIHGNLRPANVLLNQYKQVKICEYALSKQLLNRMTNNSGHNCATGMNDWMAPEILLEQNESERKNKQSTLSDVFSLGCIFYFVLCNRSHPFGDGDQISVNILLGRPQLKLKTVNKSWQQLIVKLISQNACQRIAAEAILQDACFLSPMHNVVSTAPNGTTDQSTRNTESHECFASTESMKESSIFCSTTCQQTQVQMFTYKDVQQLSPAQGAEEQDSPPSNTHSCIVRKIKPKENLQIASSKNFEVQNDSSSSGKLSGGACTTISFTQVDTEKTPELYTEVNLGQSIDLKSLTDNIKVQECAEENVCSKIFDAVVNRRPVQELGQILESNCDWRDLNFGGDSVMHLAAANGNHEAIRYFSHIGGNVNLKNQRGETPLHKINFLQENWKETFDALVELGAKVNAKNNKGITLLDKAVINGETKDAIDFIESRGGSLLYDNWQRSMLHQVAKFGHLESIEYLIANGADINDRCDRGSLPVHEINFNGANVQKLLKTLQPHRQLVNVNNKFGETLLTTAIRSGASQEIIEYIVNMGGQLKCKSQDGSSLLHYAIDSKNVDVIRYLLANGADPYAQDNSGDNAIHRLCNRLIGAKEFTSILDILLEYGVDINIPNNSMGATLLDLTVSRKMPMECTRYVYNKGGKSRPTSKLSCYHHPTFWSKANFAG